MRELKIYEAACLLVETLSGRAVPSNEVYCLAARAGIAERTLQYAKRALRVKAKKIGGGGWVMSLPENAGELLDKIGYPSSGRNQMRLSEKGAISNDFVCVIPEQMEIAAAPTVSSGRLRIKVGAVEFEAEENFPPEKLLALVRRLEAGGEC